MILIVDDDIVFTEVLGRAIEKRGYGCLLAHDVGSALALAETHSPDMAVIDLKLERESGLDLLPRLKQINPAIRMLILTGYSSIATAVAAIKLGAFDYACKPVDTDEIIALLEGHLESREKQAVEPEPPSIRRLQWEHIQKVLEANQGNVSATARVLGMHRRTLQRKLQKRPVKR
jgi:two-component system, response regulator RegA